jgi:hypothetical protein
MENLETYKVTSLDTRESLNTNGGLTPYHTLVVAVNVGLFIEGFKEGWKERKRNS